MSNGNVTINVRVDYPEALEAASHMAKLVAGSSAFISCLELEPHGGNRIDGEEWHAKAKDILARLGKRMGMEPFPE